MMNICLPGTGKYLHTLVSSGHRSKGHGCRTTFSILLSLLALGWLSGLSVVFNSVWGYKPDLRNGCEHQWTLFRKFSAYVLKRVTINWTAVYCASLSPWNLKRMLQVPCSNHKLMKFRKCFWNLSLCIECHYFTTEVLDLYIDEIYYCCCYSDLV